VVLTDSHGISRAPSYLGSPFSQRQHFGYGVRTLYDQPFKAVRLYCAVTAPVRQNRTTGPTTPTMQRPPSITHDRFSLFRFRSPLLTESLLFSLPRGTEMVHFPRFALPSYGFRRQYMSSAHVGSPIRKSTDQRMLAPHRSLSQLATSFIASKCQGIHRVPLVA
jgi:hypothetical protein